jgi:biotin carboxylase
VALDEFDQETAALVREHMRLPGMNLSTANRYRDKLAMRTSARQMGFLVPEFCGVFFYDDLRAYMERVPAPWLLKPRAEASALGIRKIEDPEKLWRTLDQLGDEQSRFLLEQFVPGDIFHVDSIVTSIRASSDAGHARGRSIHDAHRGPSQR